MSIKKISYISVILLTISTILCNYAAFIGKCSMVIAGEMLGTLIVAIFVSYKILWRKK